LLLGDAATRPVASGGKAGRLFFTQTKGIEMLSLKIKPNGKFWIGNACVTICSQANVKVLIDAPREIEILRDELKQRQGQLTHGGVRDANDSQSKTL
jgi:sRNA-binding carbon storage regulator CsrA